MSYSRWSYSKWYTYDDVCGTKSNPVFTICSEGSFYYEQLHSNMDECLNQIKEKTDCTNEELEELKGYILSFMDNYKHLSKQYDYKKEFKKVVYE